MSAAATQLAARAAETWSKLATLREFGGEAAREKVEAFTERYVKAEVTYEDAEGTHRREVVVPEVAEAEARLVGQCLKATPVT